MPWQQRAQAGYSAVEYAVLISAAAMALMASQTLVKRALQAKVKLAADEIFAFSDDRAGSPVTRGEKTQQAGIETHDAGNGFLGGEMMLQTATERTASYTETKTAGISGAITRDGTLERTSRTGASLFTDDQYVPPDFLRRSGGLDAVWDLPKGFHLPKPPPVPTQPIAPGGPDPAPTAPAPGAQRSGHGGS